MENYYVDVKDNNDYQINDKEYSDLTVLYSQCFNKNPEKSWFLSNGGIFTNLFMLKEKKTERIIAFFKIYLFNDRYELYEVCRIHPEKKCKVKNLMKKFMKKGLSMFFEWSNKDKHIYLAIDKNNKYYENAKKLYKKVGFVKTKHFKMYCLKEDSPDYRYYVFENNDNKK